MNNNLSLHDYYYDLPEELVAQVPAEKRDMSRLLVLDRKTGTIAHRHFCDILDYLNPGDALVINDSKVIPARLHGHRLNKDISGVQTDQPGTRCEVLLLKRLDEKRWETIVHPGKRLRQGAVIRFSDALVGTVQEVLPDGNRVVEFDYQGEFFSVLDTVGEMPLPPYIHSRESAKDRYQTVYAKYEGSSAAPTAGLHFTTELLEKAKAKGITVIPVTLHVGLGTFRPVKEQNIKDHKMHSEYYSVSKSSAESFNRIRHRGGRIICVGTTSCRTIESATTPDGILHDGSASTEIFIYPGYTFKGMDALITNFHLPESTLLMLVSAFSDRETILRAYREAVGERYRFFSFGDAMFIC